ncbi:hypothetical protein DSCO28_03830 [Desulfosarcina ovata subsp. sediminis]|uniref:SAF domain-containing protein n=1 Tax=Desulfosarcina ovata subsp. sediminis TaxID=885957 RepID=A0A5K7ZIM5_9BACT|nr:flagellar basal body P-ring formation chaperone FlgA [Desulfosarcina ovata]BBO79817.1 hypothetical protein DSCO28_03830 [Desulfosarcina ovata subsp. sediminis]
MIFCFKGQNRSRKQWTLPLFLGLMILLMSAGTGAAVSIEMKREANVDQDAVHLSDIAVVSGASFEKAQSVGKIVVANAPLPGQTRFVGTDYIRIRLRQAGIDTDRMSFHGATDVRVTRVAAELPAERIKKAVEMAIRSRMSWKNEDVTIGEIHLNDSLSLPTGKLTYRIVSNRNEDYLGRTILALHLFVDGEPLRRIWVDTSISVMTDVVTVVRPLGKRQTVNSEDLALERRDLKDLPADTVRRIEDALGNRTTRMIYPNTVLEADMIDTPALVRRGDIVKIIARSANMTITATGKVKQQGGMDDMVRVMNTDSNRVITARVTGPGVVEVDF